MDFLEFDPASIAEELNQFCEAMNVKQEQNGEPNGYSAAARLLAKQMTPHVFVDLTGRDPITIKTDPDQDNSFTIRRAAIENVPKKKTNDTLNKPSKPLVHRCVGRIFGLSNRRRDELNARICEQATHLLNQLDADGEDTRYADERERENIEMMEQNKENERPVTVDTTHVETPILNMDYMMANQQPVLAICDPNLLPANPKKNWSCEVCNTSYINSIGLRRHVNQTKLHRENLLKAQHLAACANAAAQSV